MERVVAEKIQRTADHLPFEVKNGKAVFELDVRRRHRAFVKRIWRYLRDSSVMIVATAPVIYSLFIPISLLDLLVCIYQAVCFPLYHIPRVSRKEYVVIDRHRLAYLNYIEKLNCAYCGYANGVLAYAREVASRTEQYWCPIKHARRVKGCHSRQCVFCEYGDAEGFRHEFDNLRKQFKDLQQTGDSVG